MGSQWVQTRLRDWTTAATLFTATLPRVSHSFLDSFICSKLSTQHLPGESTESCMGDAADLVLQQRRSQLRDAHTSGDLGGQCQLDTRGSTGPVMLSCYLPFPRWVSHILFPESFNTSCPILTLSQWLYFFFFNFIENSTKRTFASFHDHLSPNTSIWTRYSPSFPLYCIS